MKSYIKISYAMTIVVAVLVLAIFISWYLIMRAKPVYHYHTGTTEIVVLDSIKDDSLTKVSIDSIYISMKRLDEIEGRLDKLSNSYLTEVDLAVDKSNGWLAFWIGVITLVIGLSSFWQVYRQYKNDKEFQVLKDQNDKDIREMKRITKSDIERYLKDAQRTLDEQKNKIEGIEKQTKDNLEYLKKTFRETKISSLMMCLSSFPDPQMTADTEDKKKQIYKLMKNILATYIDYIENVELQEKADNIDMEAVFMVLTNLKLAIVRTHGAYSDLHQNIRFSQIIRHISEINNDILNGVPICNLTTRLRETLSLLRGLVDIIER